MFSKINKYKNKIIGFLCILSTGLVALSGSCEFGFFSRSTNKKADPVKLEISKISDVIDYDLEQLEPQTSQIKPEAWLEPYVKNDLEKINNFKTLEHSVPVEIKNTITGLERYYYYYISPYTGVEYRDFAYYDTDGNRRYLLGEKGLILLDYLFNQKVTFGPEVFSLNAININDFEIIGKQYNGFYVPNLREIFINAEAITDKGISIEVKCKFLINTIFHEYMHHWANEYAEIGLNFNNDQTSQKIISEKPNLYNRWNKNFINNFKKILNFNDKNIVNEDKNSLLIYKNYSLNDLWNVSNKEYKINEEEYKRLNKLNLTKKYIFNNNKFLDVKFSLERIKYYYSIDELVSREWTKIAFSPFTNYRDDINFEKSTSQSDLYYRFSWKGLETIRKDYVDTLDINGNMIKSDQYNLYYSAFFNDYLKIRPYLTHSTVVVEDAKDDKDTEKLFDTYIYPNDAYNFNRAKELYDLYLNTMSYGYNISSIFAHHSFGVLKVEKLDVTVQEQRDLISKIKFTGYLDEKKNYDGFVLKNKKGEKVALPFEKHAEFRFFANQNDFFKKNYEEVKLKPQNQYLYYVTKDFVDLNELDLNEPIYWWNDLNKNNMVDEDEVIDEEITINPNQVITNLRSINDQSSKKVAYLEKKDNKVKIHYNS
ncbi:hypothetical protein C4M96_01755 [Mycoplasmopsis pullorum]|uniref:MYPU_1760 family metalloprotease n=1 Tax=Mycoplasmopsis pullorum TaxID=48003 RepID=UPI001118B786|nr:hypothetical protein [Mycoplasmopsis pullorum]TNK92198.1 hypothetical protein C4M96_01755 [Mycoplasmopsis pullorum]